MGISSNSNAFTIVSTDSKNGVDVGIADILLTQQASPSGGLGDSQLTTWINNYFGNPSPAITYTTRTEDYFGYSTNDANIAAYALKSPASYFILHNAHDVALFENKASLDWAVFDWVALGVDFNIKSAGTQISFISEFNGDGSPNIEDAPPIPEPGILALLGIGLLGASMARVNKKN